ncbi:hypothetical protein [Henriciella litoralis]|uniref:hypothetical protein n=1 Tax=Henriciella litoralis TaxID=568102 RepID=UPI0009FDB5AA|nr:hypothetical protein [Henriciella litoralis]
MAKFVGEDWSAQRPQYMNSPKSKNAKFQKSICHRCNTNVSKHYDDAYSQFSEDLRAIMTDGADPNEIVNMWPWNQPLSPLGKDYRKYFEKLIGCHAAEVGAPIPEALSLSVANVLWPVRTRATILCNESWRLGIAELRKSGDPFSHVAHHGLAVLFDRETFGPKSYRSGIRIDWADVYFEYEFDDEEVEELCSDHIEFLDEARSNAKIG